MKVVVIGTGYVGLVSGACFAQMGHIVYCVDKDDSKIERLKNNEIPIYEPGLDELVEINTKCGRLAFSTNLKEVLDSAEVVLLAVGTPTDPETGRADLQYIYTAAQGVAENLRTPALIVTKSTVPVGTGQEVAAIMHQYCPDFTCEVASNPEFLREGAAINDFMHPDRVIIGAESIEAKNIMQRLYRHLIGEGVPLLFSNIATAELIKYSSNAFLATKIAFSNEISDICEGVGANVDQVLKGMGMDQRIGGQYMQPGPGYGGSCFPKDTLALTHIANDSGFPSQIVEAVISSNDDRRNRMVTKIINANGGSVAEKRIAVLGLTFKANTDDMRHSPSLVIIPKLINAGANIAVYDPQGMEEAKKELPHEQIIWCSNSYEAVKEADALVILTEWEEFKELDITKLIDQMSIPLIIDLRNIFDKDMLKTFNVQHVSLGR